MKKSPASELSVDAKYIYIVIAAYNESDRVGNVISGLLNGGYKNIIVVDDGSSDNTVQVIQKYDCYCLIHPINRGQGAALKTGIDFALQQGAKYIVTFDADGQHQVKDIAKIVRPVISKKYDIALGSRFLDKSTKMPFSRYITLKTGILVQWIFYGILLSDAHNGFRCFSAKAATTIDMTADRMEHASQIVQEIRRLRLKYSQVPVTILYTQDTLERGHGGLRQGFKVLVLFTTL